MTTTEKLLNDIERQTQTLKDLAEFVTKNREHLDRFNSGSAGITCLDQGGLYLHVAIEASPANTTDNSTVGALPHGRGSDGAADPRAFAKEFCRTTGFKWAKEYGLEEIKYKTKEPFDICIFGAEARKLEPLDLNA